MQKFTFTFPSRGANISLYNFMMYPIRYSKFFLIIGLFLGIFFVGFAMVTQAQENPFDIEFPISELGNCGSFEECRAYCDDPGNTQACIAWAEDRGIEVPHDDVTSEDVHEVLDKIGAGPGGCTNEAECQSYCNSPVNFDECTNFALEHGFITEEEAAKAHRGGPGGCQGREECDTFCSQEANIDECINFAVAEGHMSPEEAQRARRGGPGGCRTPAECDAFCRQPDNGLICIEFAVAEGHMTPEEAARIRSFIERAGPGDFGPDIGHDIGPGEPDIDVRKAQQVINELGGGPGGCQNFQECDVFCSNPTNSEVCFAFAVEHELIPAGEVERFKKLMDVEGPGGCRGRECEAYCESPGNERECIDFAVEQGFMSAEEAAEIQRFLEASEQGGPGGCRGRECEAFCNDPAHRDECFEFATRHGLLSPEELKEIEKFRAIERKIENEGGPGGCRSEIECRTYCSDPSHLDECAAFAVNEGLFSLEEAQGLIREFIEIEQFGPGGFGSPHGFGPGGPGDFGSGAGFAPGEFPPGFENIPPEFRDRVENEFQKRFDSFEQFREEFEHGRFPAGSSGEFRPPVEFPGPDEFPTPREFPGEFPLGPQPANFQIAPLEFQGSVQDEFQRQFDSEIQKQFQNEFQKQFEERAQQFLPGEFEGSQFEIYDQFQLRELESFQNVPTFPEGGLQIPIIPQDGFKIPEEFLRDGTQSLVKPLVLIANIVNALNSLSVIR